MLICVVLPLNQWHWTIMTLNTIMEMTVVLTWISIILKLSERISCCFRPTQCSSVSLSLEKSSVPDWARNLCSWDSSPAFWLRGPSQAGIPSRLGYWPRQRRLWSFPILQSRRPQDTFPPAAQVQDHLYSPLGGRERWNEPTSGSRLSSDKSGEYRGEWWERWGRESGKRWGVLRCLCTLEISLIKTWQPREDCKHLQWL